MIVHISEKHYRNQFISMNNYSPIFSPLRPPTKKKQNTHTQRNTTKTTPKITIVSQNWCLENVLPTSKTVILRVSKWKKKTGVFSWCFFSQIIHPTSDPTASSTKSSTLNSTRPSNGSPAKATDPWERLGSVEISEMEALENSSWIHWERGC